MKCDILNYHSGPYAGSGSANPWTWEYPRHCELHFTTENIHNSSSLGRASALKSWVGVIGDTLFVSFEDLRWQSGDFLWRHGRTFCSQMQFGNRQGPLGSGWTLPDMPFLVEEHSEVGRIRVGVVAGVASVEWFKVDDGGSWMATSGRPAVFQHDTVYRSFLWRSGSMIWIFHSFDNSLPRQIRGHLKEVRSAAGIVAKVEYGRHNEIERVVWRNPDHSVTEFHYEYSDQHPCATLRRVTLTHRGIGLRRVHYEQHAPTHHTYMLRSARTDLWRESRWQTDYEVLYRYRGTRLLRDFDIIDAAHSESGQAILPAASYSIQYNDGGRVRWIRHQGHGPAPVFR